MTPNRDWQRRQIPEIVLNVAMFPIIYNLNGPVLQFCERVIWNLIAKCVTALLHTFVQ